ncbi:FAD-dependent monooxygenase [Aquincola sp. S2]|uniref:FAD-dependent monooxygenase n=1 Tax=Pseudaquabacterium terrae TaxID=2732868 RepID=A0ABX2EQ27_9BURK|nr:FAD-dependent monooxygenase [Aquabacterium terrae]NRF70752.1 FAD-dependent monooxygenase [Aquabacterium terrae]
MWFSKSPQMLGRRALVLGASMAGLLAARILAERFDEVWLLERDALPDGPAPRKGTPQALHAHGLLARGREILESLFPGFTAALEAQGALVGDLQANAPFVAAGRRFAHGTACGRAGIACSRLAVEAEVRRRVLALSRVRALTDVDILQPTLDEARPRVTGVRIAQRSGGAQQTLAADLVVDCTGRGSRTPAWLRDWGFDAPEEERVTVGIGYATTYLKREPQHAPGIAALVFAATPQLPMPGVLLAQEACADGVARWVVTLGGYAGDHPAPTLEGMRERARRMGDPALLRILREAEPLAPVTRYSFAHSQRRHFEKLRRFPQRFLVMGDAIASFNPVYGQGMSVAASEALALRDALATGLESLHARFFIAASKAIDVPWQLAVGADLAIPSVPGARPAPVRFVNAYLARVFRAAEHDPAVALAFMKVAHLVAAPASLFAPGMLVRVLRRAVRAEVSLPLEEVIH